MASVLKISVWHVISGKKKKKCFVQKWMLNVLNKICQENTCIFCHLYVALRCLLANQSIFFFSLTLQLFVIHLRGN